MDHLISLPNIDTIKLDLKGYTHGYWPSRKVKKENIFYIDNLGQMIKIHVPTFLKQFQTTELKDDITYYKGQRRMKLKKESTESLLIKLEQAKKVAKLYERVSETEMRSVYEEADGLEIERELKSRDVSYEGLE